MNEKAICKHLEPQPETCKWCNMAINKDTRYGKKWWPHLFVKDVYQKPQQILPKSQPGLIQKALNFGQALVTHVTTGMTNANEEEMERRLNICRSCTGIGGYYDEKRDMCTHPKCGCKMSRKARWSSSKCPLGKWGVSLSLVD